LSVGQSRYIMEECKAHRPGGGERGEGGKGGSWKEGGTSRGLPRALGSI